MGGPIIKDKLFYFGAFERQTYNVSGSYPVYSTDFERTLDVTQSIPAPNGPGNELSLAQPAQPETIATLRDQQRTHQRNQAYGFPNVVSIYNVLGKIDYHFSDHHTIAGSYFLGNGTTIAESITNPGLTQPQFQGQRDGSARNSSPRAGPGRRIPLG